jgi:hypothetical protein
MFNLIEFFNNSYLLSMSKQLKIVKQAEISGDLSKEQKRFNSYLRKIRALKKEMADIEAAALELTRLGQKKIRPVKDVLMERWKELILTLDQSPFAAKLSKNQRLNYEDVMLDLIINWIDAADVEDAEMIELHDKYHEEDFRSLQEMEMRQMRDSAAAAFRSQTGLDLDPDDLAFDPDDPESVLKFQEKMEEMKQQFEEKEAAAKARKGKKEKTAKQLDAEKKQKAAASALQKTAKEIYMDLVKNFHPDTEADENEKQSKTAIMQQITAAYSEKDYIKLIELQMSLLDRDNALASKGDEQLKHVNEVLKKQIEELESQAYFAHPGRRSNHPYSGLFDPNIAVMKWRVNKYVEDCKHNTKVYSHQLAGIRDARGFKTFISEYEIEEEGMDFGDFLEIFGRGR